MILFTFFLISVLSDLKSNTVSKLSSIFKITLSKINSGEAPFVSEPIFLITINGIFLFKKSFFIELTLAFISKSTIFNSLIKKVLELFFRHHYFLFYFCLFSVHYQLWLIFFFNIWMKILHFFDNFDIVFKN